MRSWTILRSEREFDAVANKCRKRRENAKSSVTGDKDEVVVTGEA